MHDAKCKQCGMVHKGRCNLNDVAILCEGCGVVHKRGKACPVCDLRGTMAAQKIADALGFLLK